MPPRWAGAHGSAIIAAMNDVLAMVLAGGRVDAMGVLTARRSMAAVPFGGFYRVMRFDVAAA